MQGLPLPLDPTATEKLEGFVALLMQWNAGMRLIGDATYKEVLSRHLLDSLRGWQDIVEHGFASSCSKIADLGSGAGLPGVPVACVAPDIQVECWETRRKRIDFLMHVKHRLGLDNLIPVHKRIEPDATLGPYGPYDLALTRAWLPPLQAMTQATPLMASGGRLALWVGESDLQTAWVPPADWHIEWRSTQSPSSAPAGNGGLLIAQYRHV